MGLDMYLNRTYCVSNYDFEPDSRQSAFQKICDALGTKSEITGSITVRLPGVYWRKCNQVHNWFVNNCQNGEDNCGYYYVSREQVEELLGIVKQILANHELAGELLPPQSGFFFGDTEINEYYFQDLEYTQKNLERLLASTEGDAFGGYEYHSSW